MSTALFIKNIDLETKIKVVISEGIIIINSIAGEGYNKREVYSIIYASVLGITAANT